MCWTQTHCRTSKTRRGSGKPRRLYDLLFIAIRVMDQHLNAREKPAKKQKNANAACPRTIRPHTSAGRLRERFVAQ